MSFPRLKVVVVEDSAQKGKPMYKWRIFDLKTLPPKVLVFGAAGTLIEALCFAGNESLRLATLQEPASYLGIVAKGDTPF